MLKVSIVLINPHFGINMSSLVFHIYENTSGTQKYAPLESKSPPPPPRYLTNGKESLCFSLCVCKESLRDDEGEGQYFCIKLTNTDNELYSSNKVTNHLFYNYVFLRPRQTGHDLTARREFSISTSFNFNPFLLSSNLRKDFSNLSYLVHISNQISFR